ncbi:DUF1292 domain-containing protein [Halobacillus seohaensis]|uniref:UPF0473 protein ACFQIC_18940 n=1 Tax=Halobacillus seohaensis TaxID=447421 RepID=A0ABW2ER42_9BACI
MALEKEERITIPDENGDEHLFEVLFTFDVEQTESTYIAVSPAEPSEDEDVEVFTFRYEEKADEGEDLALYQIESDEEWELVDEKLNALIDQDLN